MGRIGELREIFLISGFSRGGTNILWNLVCSHPEVLTTGLELNEILGPSRTGIPLYWKALIEAYAIPGITPPGLVSHYGCKRVFAQADQHATESWGRWSTPVDRYAVDELYQLPVCTKSVNSWARDWLFGMLQRNIALKYNGMLYRYHRPMKTVYLIRDAHAVCNGWMRRGCKPYEAGKWYQYIGRRMLKDYARRPGEVIFINFQDVLNQPVLTARAVQRYFGLCDTDILSYHLKMKKVLNAAGEHHVRQGKEGAMVWVDKQDLGDFLDIGVDTNQRMMLDSVARSMFESGLGEIALELDRVCEGKRGKQMCS